MHVNMIRCEITDVYEAGRHYGISFVRPDGSHGTLYYGRADFRKAFGRPRSGMFEGMVLDLWEEEGKGYCAIV